MNLAADARREEKFYRTKAAKRGQICESGLQLQDLVAKVAN